MTKTMFFGNQEIFKKQENRKLLQIALLKSTKSFSDAFLKLQNLQFLKQERKKMTRTRLVMRLFDPPLLSYHRDHVLSLFEALSRPHLEQERINSIKEKQKIKSKSQTCSKNHPFLKSFLKIPIKLKSSFSKKKPF